MSQHIPADYTQFVDLSDEAKRLARQGHFFYRFTRRFFESAGITAGMKVLDVGSGAGDVALLLAELVGPQGTVVGVDMNAGSLQTARQRTHAAGLSNVSFLEGDITQVEFDDDYDAIVGRFVLIYVQDKARVLHRLVEHLRPGGIIGFQEPYIAQTGTASPAAPLFTQVSKWNIETFRRAKLDTDIGVTLYHLFLDAGLPDPEMDVMISVGGGSHWAGYENMADVARALLPLMLKLGVTTAEAMDIETLEQRLREEAVKQQGVAMGIGFMSAWARKG
jgi:ubiquinone/menaquinone biosynthesis C-methylase UbiE